MERGCFHIHLLYVKIVESCHSKESLKGHGFNHRCKGLIRVHPPPVGDNLWLPIELWTEWSDRPLLFLSYLPSFLLRVSMTSCHTFFRDQHPYLMLNQGVHLLLYCLSSLLSFLRCHGFFICFRLLFIKAIRSIGKVFKICYIFYSNSVCQTDKRILFVQWQIQCWTTRRGPLPCTPIWNIKNFRQMREKYSNIIIHPSIIAFGRLRNSTRPCSNGVYWQDQVQL